MTSPDTIPPMPRTYGPYCTHLHVEYRTENFKYDGPDHPVTDPTSPNVPLRHGATLTREWWECRDCKTKFAPEGNRRALPSPAPAPAPAATHTIIVRVEHEHHDRVDYSGLDG